jgi:hypothetical protein
MIQDLIAISIALLAAVYVGRVCWLALQAKRSGGCGSCGGCASSEKPLVQVVIPRETRQPRDLGMSLHSHGNTNSG